MSTCVSNEKIFLFSPQLEDITKQPHVMDFQMQNNFLLKKNLGAGGSCLES
jgi:hypothetical protein